MKRLTTLLWFLCLGVTGFSQAEETSGLYETLKEKDSLLFTVGFNTCDINQFEMLVSDDFEFYHDQAGVTSTKKAFIEGIRAGLCKLDYRARRALVTNSLAVYPLTKNGVLYGAVQTGEHRFYALEKGKAEHLTSIAKFTHLWLLENGDWKLSRGLSYDHRQTN